MTGRKFNYTIVQINCSEKFNESVDSAIHIVAVPSSWIYFSKSLQALVTKYIFPPYNDEDELLLEELLLSKANDPPEIWSEYAVIVRGEASKILCIFRVCSLRVKRVKRAHAYKRYFRWFN